MNDGSIDVHGDGTGPEGSNPAVTPAVASWEVRPFLLSGLLALAGLLFYLITDPAGPNGEDSPWRMALGTFVVVGPLMLAFTLEEHRRRGALLFALAVGAVMAGIAWRVARAANTHADAPFWFFAAALAGVLALPLFQAGFLRQRWRTPYALTHWHVWTDAISAAGALAFTGLSWLLLFLLSELFAAIEITALRELVQEGWFGWTFSGAAFGASLGVLRNHAAILGTLQRVVMIVFAILAVPLAAALVVFLAAVAFSGLDVLWNATRSATPLLLGAALGAFVLANAVLRDSDADMSASRVQRIAAAALALGVLPLAVLAAVSMGVRIGQHGLSPERLWGLVAIVVAVAYGLGYFVAAILSRRQGWDRLRLTNLHLAVGTGVAALVLALPILDFGAISARNQVARLESGRVSARDFDYAALRWDFGPAGRAALAEIARGAGEPARSARAQLAKKGESRYAPPPVKDMAVAYSSADPALRRSVTAFLEQNPWQCDNEGCYILDLGTAPGGRRIAIVNGSSVYVSTLNAKGEDVENVASESASPQYRPGDRVEVREVVRRYVTVNGQVIGGPLDDDPSALEPPAAPR